MVVMYWCLGACAVYWTVCSGGWRHWDGEGERETEREKEGERLREMQTCIREWGDRRSSNS